MIAMNNGRVIFTLNAVKIVPLMSAMDVSSGHSSLKGRKQNIIGANTVRDVSRLWWTLGGRSNCFVAGFISEKKKYMLEIPYVCGTT